jgi:hypothetical protein
LASTTCKLLTACIKQALTPVSALLLAALSPTLTHAEWFRGNTHTHTINSDGNASPDEVVRWYRQHGYQFVVITDHEFITDVAPLQALLGAEGKFLVMKGQEVSQAVGDIEHPNDIRTAHVNAINAGTVVMPLSGGQHRLIASKDVSVSDTFARNIAAITAAGGIAQVNHPNFLWSIGADDMARIPDGTLFELWNAHPFSHNLGGADDAGQRAPSTEELWDVLLTRGQILWAVGSDDSHEYKDWQDPNAPRPGQAWIMVNAERLTPDAITSSLRRGNFYASTGIFLERVSVSSERIAIAIKQDTSVGITSLPGDSRFVTRFIGAGGAVVAEVTGLNPSYKFQPDDIYVRASIIDSRNRRAWTQPVFLKSLTSRLQRK